METIDLEREQRILEKVFQDQMDSAQVVDAWYDYMSASLLYPFKVKMGEKEEEIFEVIELAPREQFETDFIVGLRFGEDTMYAPILDLFVMGAAPKTMTAIEDWRYWRKKNKKI